MQTYRHVIKPEIPVVDPAKVEDLRAERHALQIVRHIETANLDGCLPPIENFLSGIPDLTQLARRTHQTAKDLELHLQIESCFWTIARIRIEKPGVHVARKTEGYISTNPTVLRAMGATVSRLVEAEYWRRFSRPMPAAQVYDVFKDSIDSFEGTPLGRLLRVYGAIREISEKNACSPWIGSDHFHEVVERNLWRRATLKWHAKKDSPKPERARGVRHSKQIRKNPWEKSFEFLGAFLTCRLLLRREELGELETWIDNNPSHPDLPRVYYDAAISRDWLVTERKFSGQQIEDLDRILGKLLASMRAGSSLHGANTEEPALLASRPGQE